MKKSLLTSVLLAFMAACDASSDETDDEGGESDDEVVVDQALLDAGDAVFAGVCSECHGADGTGLFNASDLTVVVPDMTEAEVRTTITDGSGQMQPQSVTGADLDAVVYYVTHTFGG